MSIGCICEICFKEKENQVKSSLCYLIWLHWTVLENELGKFMSNTICFKVRQ